ncbi:unnamed protein product [Lepidochelys kempii]
MLILILLPTAFLLPPGAGQHLCFPGSHRLYGPGIELAMDPALSHNPDYNKENIHNDIMLLKSYRVSGARPPAVGRSPRQPRLRVQHGRVGSDRREHHHRQAAGGGAGGGVRPPVQRLVPP